MHRDMLIDQIEESTGGRVTTAPPAITRAGTWRATVHGGDVKLVSTRGATEEEALEMLGSAIVVQRERLGIIP